MTLLQRLPAERAGKDAAEIRDEVDRIRHEIVPLENPALLARIEDDPNLLDLFRGLGADLSILTYAFNFRTAHGVNRDLGLMNQLNDAVFQALSHQSDHGGGVPREEMFLTASRFDPADFGQGFVDRFAARAGGDPSPGVAANVLISTTQNPWLTDTAAPDGRGNFIPRLMEVLRRTVMREIGDLLHRHGLDPLVPP
ncbi:hypothetical protein ACRDNQ_05155 [Palleronia sp. KMU-117]|uniref:hypothetical protein n=1 Tax=Palleronia sp. KMU-117 TaxID=3434108 RepID=UPI003D73C450